MWAKEELCQSVRITLHEVRMKLHVPVQFYSVQSTNWSSDNCILVMKFYVVCELDFAATCMLMLTIGTVGGHTEELMVIIIIPTYAQLCSGILILQLLLTSTPHTHTHTKTHLTSNYIHSHIYQHYITITTHYSIVFYQFNNS
jgi:hypothetical protein